MTPLPLLRRTLLALALGTLATGLALARTATETPVRLPVFVPESAGSDANDPGNLAHTRLRVLDTAKAATNSAPTGNVLINSPAMLRSVYSLPSTGGSGAIAIVDAYHYPTALNDFNVFASQYGLTKETSTNATSPSNKVFEVVYANGRKPASGGDYIDSWNLEAALDIEWAHAMAPGAKIYLVEAASASNNDLFLAVRVAASLPGVREVSMSWGEGEWPGEVRYDSLFTGNGVVFLAAGGDASDTIEYPSASPNVVSVGGTTLNRDASGNFLSETAWDETGCGISRYEPRPTYQSALSSLLGKKRGTNDLSFVADPNTGVYVYDSTPLWGEAGWWTVGGTSLSTPAIAGVLNLAATASASSASAAVREVSLFGTQFGPYRFIGSSFGNVSSSGFAASSVAELTRIYDNLGKAGDFRDISSGTDGTLSATPGWDFVTGVGSPVGLGGK